MRTVGIVAEYNPFHGGHLTHLRRSLATAGAEAAVCVLSGDFVQRGEAAVFSNFARAEAAVRCGVSLVLELPLPWSLASAGVFARGAVAVLGSTGVVDCLSFGSECGDIAALRALAEALDTPEWEEELHRTAERGEPFARRRERALAALAGEERAALLRAPNNNLGVEYLLALRRLGLSMTAVTVSREGSVHDGPFSASELRAALRRGEDVSGAIPPGAWEVYEREITSGRGPMDMPDLEQALLSRLRVLPETRFAALPDAGEGLENLLYAAAREAPDLESAAAMCKSKRYALARIRRMLLSAALGMERGMTDGTPPYLRVLAADEKGRELLREMRTKARLPVIIKSADVRRETPESAMLFELGSAARDLWVLGCREAEDRRGGADYRYSPAML